MHAVRALFALAVSAALPVQTQPAFQLTVDSIMRGPGLVGYQPREIRWSGRGDRIYFEWKQATDPLRNDFDLYEVKPDGGGLLKIPPEEKKLIPPAQGGDTTKDRRFTTYVNGGDIYLYDHSAARARALTTTSESETSPRFLRDGKRIAYTRANNLFVISIDNGSIVQLTDIKPPGTPVPPEEKKRTASQEYLKHEERELLQSIRDRALKKEEDEAQKKKENPRKPFRLGARQSISGLQLSPDESVIAAIITEKPASTDTQPGPKQSLIPSYVTESAYTEAPPFRTKVGDVMDSQRLALINVVSGELTWVDSPLKKPEPAKDTEQQKESKEPAKTPERTVRFTTPHWSEDGTRAYLTATSTDNKDWWLLALDQASGKTRQLATIHDDAWVNIRSDDGWMKNDRDIFFLSEADGFMHLYVVSSDGGQPRQITSGRWEIFEAKLSQDKSRFFLETSEQNPGERHVYLMDAAGAARRKLTGSSGRYTAVVSPDERALALVYSYVNKPPELFVQPVDNPAASIKVTSSPLPEFWSWKWQDAPTVSIPAGDGVAVPARLYKPSTPRKAGPAVIFVHGAGYLQNIHKGWSQYFREYMFHHILMERGYTVLDIDYRGSANYGRDWRTAIYRHMGGRDLQDHVDAARWLISEHGVDPKRIGIYGGSYGGFITLMAMFQHGDLFRAGAALRPVTDWAHYNHGYTSDILNTPQNDPEAYKRSSPIYFADGLKGALLMCHGIVDVNVHVQDTIRLAQRLIELRKENWEMALYPVEDHGFVQPTSWADEYKRILKLFETNLSVKEQRNR